VKFEGKSEALGERMRGAGRAKRQGKKKEGRIGKRHGDAADKPKPTPDE